MIATAREHSNDCDRTWCIARSVLLACALAAVGAWPAPPAWQLDLPQSIAAAEAEVAEYLTPGQGESVPFAEAAPTERHVAMRSDCAPLTIGQALFDKWLGGSTTAVTRAALASLPQRTRLASVLPLLGLGGSELLMEHPTGYRMRVQNVTLVEVGEEYSVRFGVCWDDLEWWEQQDVLTRMIVITTISVDLELDFAIEQQLGPWLSYVHYLEGRMAVSLTGFLTLHLDLNAMHERAVSACDGKFEFVHLSTEVGGIYSDLRLAGTVKTLVQGIAPLFAQEVAPMLCRGDLADVAGLTVSHGMGVELFDDDGRRTHFPGLALEVQRRIRSHEQLLGFLRGPNTDERRQAALVDRARLHEVGVSAMLGEGRFSNVPAYYDDFIEAGGELPTAKDLAATDAAMEEGLFGLTDGNGAYLTRVDLFVETSAMLAGETQPIPILVERPLTTTAVASCDGWDCSVRGQVCAQGWTCCAEARALGCTGGLCWFANSDLPSAGKCTPEAATAESKLSAAKASAAKVAVAVTHPFRTSPEAVYGCHKLTSHEAVGVDSERPPPPPPPGPPQHCTRRPQLEVVARFTPSEEGLGFLIGGSGRGSFEMELRAPSRGEMRAVLREERGPDHRADTWAVDAASAAGEPLHRYGKVERRSGVGGSMVADRFVYSQWRREQAWAWPWGGGGEEREVLSPLLELDVLQAPSWSEMGKGRPAESLPPLRAVIRLAGTDTVVGVVGESRSGRHFGLWREMVVWAARDVDVLGGFALSFASVFMAEGWEALRKLADSPWALSAAAAGAPFAARHALHDAAARGDGPLRFSFDFAPGGVLRDASAHAAAD